MWRRISHALAWAFYGNSNVSLCAEMARRRAACRFCRCVCRALEFVPTFGPGHCDEEMEMYMKTNRLPGPLTKADTAWWKVFQKENGLFVDGKVGTQTTGALAVLLGEYESENEFLKARIRNAYIMLAVALAGGAGVLGSM